MYSAIFLSSIPITDWIQAIATAIGIPAAIVGFYNLFKKDKNRQAEITSLASLASSQATMIEKISEQIEIDKRRHLQSILPFFNDIKPLVHNDSTFRLELTNTGDRCKFKGFEWDYSLNVEIDSISGIHIFVERNESVFIKGHAIDNINFYQHGLFSIWLWFEDLEGNQYHQKVTKGVFRFYINKPVLFQGSITTSIQKTIRDASSRYIH